MLPGNVALVRARPTHSEGPLPPLLTLRRELLFELKACSRRKDRTPEATRVLCPKHHPRLFAGPSALPSAQRGEAVACFLTVTDMLGPELCLTLMLYFELFQDTSTM